MTFDKLISILEQEQDEESWVYWLEDNDYDIPISDIKNLIEKCNLVYTRKIDGRLSCLSDGKDEVYLEKTSDDACDVWAWNRDEVISNVTRMHSDDMLDLLGIPEEDVWISGWECSIKDAQEHPGTVFHYTTEEKWEDIQKDGGMHTSYGSALSNTNENGIFTSVDPEEYSMGQYGDVCLAIDLSSFMKDLGLSRLDIRPEPEVLESEVANLLYNKLGIDEKHEVSSSSGMSSLTMIVSHDVPLKYITEYGN